MRRGGVPQALLGVFLVALLPRAAQADRVVPSERVQHEVSVKAAPRSASATIGALAPGDSLPFVRNVPRYREVRLAGGQAGFVAKAFTTVVRELAAREQNELRVHFLNVGAGNCTVVECPGAGNPPPMVVDCGSLGGTARDMRRDDARTYVQAILAGHEGRANLVISHADQDHYGWVPEVVGGIRLANIWQGGDPAGYSEEGFPAWIAGQEANGAALHRGFDPDFHNGGEPLGQTLACGDAAVFILTVNSGGSPNAESLVLAIDYDEFSVTLTGDAEGTTETAARANFDEAVKTTVLSGSHHGARTHDSNGPDWAAATFPEVVVFSAGRRFGHPQCEAVGRYVASAAPAPAHPTQCGEGFDYEPEDSSRQAIYMTEINGRVVVTSNGRSPLALFCTGSKGCDAQIPH